jgi:hypothetical protein
MKRTLLLAALGTTLVVLLAVAFLHSRGSSAMADESQGPMLIHNVYFKLADSTPEGREALVAACRKYLDGHPGTAFFAVGTVADLDRPVNDRDWDVNLCLVFEDRAAHDAYQTHERHLKFIDENKATWAGVRVFDADAE